MCKLRARGPGLITDNNPVPNTYPKSANNLATQSADNYPCAYTVSQHFRRQFFDRAIELDSRTDVMNLHRTRLVPPVESTTGSVSKLKSNCEHECRSDRQKHLILSSSVSSTRTSVVCVCDCVCVHCSLSLSVGAHLRRRSSMMHPPYSIISLPCPGFLLRGVRP